MYSVIDEKFKIYEIIKFGRRLVFTNIKEEDKEVELEHAAMFRFGVNYKKQIVKEKNGKEYTKYVNLKNKDEYLKLISDTEQTRLKLIPQLSNAV